MEKTELATEANRNDEQDCSNDLPVATDNDVTKTAEEHPKEDGVSEEEEDDDASKENETSKETVDVKMEEDIDRLSTVVEETSQDMVSSPVSPEAVVQEDVKNSMEEEDDDIKVIASFRGRKKGQRGRPTRGRRPSNASCTSSNSSEKKHLPLRPGIVFEIGAKLLARDKSRIWYDAKIVDIDEIGNEIKIHFDRWNSRYDQWFSMDSNDLRGVATAQKKNEKSFIVGDEILAKWKDQNMYPAKVESCCDNGSYLVIFYDGFVCKMHAANMENLPSRCVGKWKFPTLEESKKIKRASLGGGVLNSAAQTEQLQDPISRSEANEGQTSQLPLDVWEVLQIPPPSSSQVPSTYDVKRNSLPYPAVATKEFVIKEDHNQFKCDVEGCLKSFRKEKLLESHYKHYHNRKYIPTLTLESPSRPVRMQGRRVDSAKSTGIKRDRAIKERRSLPIFKIKQEPLSEEEEEEEEPSSLFIPRTEPPERNIVPKTSSEHKAKVEKRTSVSKTSTSVSKTSTSVAPQRSSTRRISLPAKFANSEICLMQPLGRERNISCSSQMSDGDSEFSRSVIKRSRTKTIPQKVATSPNIGKSSKEVAKKIEFDPNIRIKPEPLSEDETMNSDVPKGPAGVKRISLSGNVDPEKIEKMITIASSKRRPFPKSKTYEPEKINIDPKRSFVICSRESSKSAKKLPKKTEDSSEAKPTVEKSDYSEIPKSQEVETKIPPEEPPPEKEIVEFQPDSVPTSMPDVISSIASEKVTTPPSQLSEAVIKSTSDAIKPLSDSVFEVKSLINNFDRKKIEMPLKPPDLTSPNAGHVMCTRRKEAILEKEKAAQSIGGHVMCTRKKSEKLAAVEQKFKKKLKSPVKGEPTPPGLSRKRKFYSPTSIGAAKKPALENADSANDDIVAQPELKTSQTIKPPLKVVTPDVADTGANISVAEEKSTAKAVMDEVVHCVCGLSEEEGLMMQD